jgi:hypothetical protein
MNDAGIEEILDLPFDQYQRYRLTAEIVQMIKADQRKRMKVLDVGGCATRRDRRGYFLPIQLFLPGDDITVMDVVDFQDPLYVKSDGCDLHFPEEWFDVVVCNDVLEHILPSERKTFVENLIRMSKTYVILATPYKTKLNELAEYHLSQFIQKRLNAVHEQLKEHNDLGLPRKEEVEEILKGSGVAFFSFPSGNVYQWFLMMVLKHYTMGFPDSELLHRKIDRFYNQNLWEETGSLHAYRYFFVILKGLSRSSSLIKKMEKRFCYPGLNTSEAELEVRENFFRSILDLIWEFHQKTPWGKMDSKGRRLKKWFSEG